MDGLRLVCRRGESHTNPRPKALLVSTCRWYSSARLAVALSEAGFILNAVCLADHPISKTSAVSRLYPYRALAPLRSLADAIRTSKPDLLLPCDDLASEHLQDLHGGRPDRSEGAAPVSEIVERSIGRAASFPILRRRAEFMHFAQQQGVRVPKTLAISHPSDLASLSSAVGFPAVLKTNGSTGGDGVRVVESLQEAERGYRILNSPPIFARALKRGAVSEDWTLFRQWIRREKPGVSAQAFISGREATTLVACWQGAVLGALHFEVIHKRDASGPATVLRVSENQEMHAATATMVQRLGLSGLHGFDFMIETSTENAYLIEINPRATQVGHLTLGPGRDLPAALFAAATGQPLRAAPRITDKETIAMFPYEWARNPKSEFLTEGYHDVPWSQPALLLDMLEKLKKRRSAKTHQKLAHFFSPVKSSRTSRS